jgi:hypothetical protein
MNKFELEKVVELQSKNAFVLDGKLYFNDPMKKWVVHGLNEQRSWIPEKLDDLVMLLNVDIFDAPDGFYAMQATMLCGGCKLHRKDKCLDMEGVNCCRAERSDDQLVIFKVIEN